MAKTLAQPPLTLDNGPNDLGMYFYISDAGSGNVPRVTVTYFRSGTAVRQSDHAISEYTTLTPAQKTSFRSMALAIRDETFTLDGAV